MINIEKIEELVNFIKNSDNETEQYDALVDLSKLAREESHKISQTDGVSNFFTAINEYKNDIVNYLGQYISDNNIDIHGKINISNYCCKKSVAIFFSPDKDYKDYIKSYNGLAEVVKTSTVNRTIFNLIGDKEDTIMTKSQLEKFMRFRKQNPDYVKEVCRDIICCINNIKYKEEI